MLTVPDPALGDGTVVLRPWQPGDVDALVEACADPDISRWTTVGWPYTADDARAFLERSDCGWRSGRTASFAVTAATDAVATAGTVLGAVDVKLPPVDPPRSGEGGYWVAAPARGRGVATAALKLVASWALGPVGLRVMTLQVLDGNTGSMRVAEQAGFHRVGKVEGTMGGTVQVAHLYARHARRR